LPSAGKAISVVDDVRQSLDHFALKPRCGDEESKARIRVIGAHKRPLLASVSEAIGGRKCSNGSRLTRRGGLLRGQRSRQKSRVTFSILTIFMPHAQFVEQVAGLAPSQEPLKTSHLSAGGIASLLRYLRIAEARRAQIWIHEKVASLGHILKRFLCMQSSA
jgi:hypothetical protein